MSVEIYPVVHINRSVGLAVEQAEVAREAGADGVYLIDHNGYTPINLIDTYNATVEQNPAFFVGINNLYARSGLETFEMLLESKKQDQLIRYPDGLWVDDADPNKEEIVRYRERYPALKAIHYFGGVAFKGTNLYTDVPEIAALEARKLMDYVDVVTTSGFGTGLPPNAAKIKAMKEVIGNKDLAIASGVSLENIGDYAGLFDKLLVASSVETAKYSGVFDEKVLRETIQAAHEL